jgi:hypothetical protein
MFFTAGAFGWWVNRSQTADIPAASGACENMQGLACADHCNASGIESAHCVGASVDGARAHPPEIIVSKGDRVARERAVNRCKAPGSSLSGRNIGIECLADSILHTGAARIGCVPLPGHRGRSHSG